MYCKQPRCGSYALNIAPESGYCDVCYYKNLLIDLLAEVHEEDGRSTEKLALEKSVEAAKEIVKASHDVVRSAESVSKKIALVREKLEEGE